MSDTSSHNHRLQLHNFLQANGVSNRLRWQTAHAGPQHKLIWTAICYIGDIEYGRASGLTLAHAKEGAARIALRALLFESFRQRQRQG